MIKKFLKKIREFATYEIMENQSQIIKNQLKIYEKLADLCEIKNLFGLLNYSNCKPNALQEKAKDLAAFHLITNTKIKFDFSKESCKNAQDVFALLKPMDVFGKKKVRLGAEHDGGYITIEPEQRKKNDGIAYSFGISTYDPWSLAMAERGYNVFQYDGTVENSPYNNSMIRFFQYMVTGSSSPKPNEKNIKQIFEDHGHSGKNIFLNIDIEGSEWDFFEMITREEMQQFEQIIVEFHELLLDDGKLPKKIEILKKLNETHQCIHLHANNGACPDLVTILPGFRQFPALMEVTYIRKDPDYKFTECFDEFPGQLDSPNDPFFPDLYLGVLNEPK